MLNSLTIMLRVKGDDNQKLFWFVKTSVWVESATVSTWPSVHTLLKLVIFQFCFIFGFTELF